MRKIFLVFVAIACIIYLINPGMGFFEILPDQLPFVGNLDEVSITILLIKVLKELGLNIFKDKADKKISK